MKTRVFRGAQWVFFEILLKNLMLFGFMIALMRLLSPAEFGVIAMLSLFVGVASALSEGGLGAALIQAKEPSQTDISTIFWTQLVLAVLLAGALAAMGPLLAKMFNQEILVALSMAYGANIIISALASVHMSLFTKQLEFRVLMLSSLSAHAVGGMAAIIAALLGAGPWAIFTQAFAASSVISILLWWFSSWRPTLVYSLFSLRRFGRFGLYVVGASILGEIETRGSAFILGQVSSPANTGHYQRGVSLQQQFVRAISGVVTRVAFPAFSLIQDDKQRLLSSVRQAVVLSFALSAFLMWSIALVAEPLIPLVFGSAWMPMMPVLQAFCVVAGFYPIFAVYSKAIRAVGKADVVFFQYCIRVIGVISIAIFVADQGIIFLAWSQAAFLIILITLFAHHIRKWVGYSLKEQLTDLFPVMLAGGAMAAADLMLDSALSSYADYTKVFAAVSIMLISFIGVIGIWVFIYPKSVARLAINNSFDQFLHMRPSL